MKRLLIFVCIITLIGISMVEAQVSTTSYPKNEEKNQIVNEPYDSTENFLGNNVYQYIGQELYLNGKSESFRKYGYHNFFLDYTKSRMDKTNIYKCCDRHNSKYNELAEKYFKVLDVIKHPKAKEDEYLYGSKYYLKLECKENGDTLYYEYDSKYGSSFPFIVVAYFQKMKKEFNGKEYVIRGRNWISDEPMVDIKTGKEVDFSVGSVWKCIDFTIEKRFYSLSLIIQNSKGEQIPLSLDHIIDHFVFAKEDADKYLQEFGEDNWQKILVGTVEIGMTDEMCRLSWGEPEDINTTIVGSSIHEQWVYGSGSYLYFEDGILTSIQY